MSPTHRFAVLVCLLVSFTARAPGAAYTMTDLGTLGGTTTTAVGINNNGQIAGNSLDAAGNRFAFIWSNGQMTSLGNDGALTAGARNINSSGQVEGNLSNADIFVWTGGTWKDGGIPLSGSTCKAYGFNNAGQVTGQVTLPSGQIHGFVYNSSNGTSVDIGTMGGNPTDFSYGSSINSSGQVEGDSINSAGLDHAFIWTAGTFKDLGTFGGPASSGISINNLGHATGTSQTTGDAASDVFFWNGTTLVNCGTLGGTFANAAGAINNLDQIVGYSYLADNVTENAFVVNNGVMSNLNSLIPANSGWTLTRATGINDSGEIIANGTNSSGATDAFLLTPTPEPGAMSLLIPAIWLLARRGRLSWA